MEIHSFPKSQSDNVDQKLGIFLKQFCPSEQGMTKTVNICKFYGD